MNDYSYKFIQSCVNKADIELGPHEAALIEEGNVLTGASDFEKYFSKADSAEIDLLRLACATFAADRASSRGG